jgi:hypothetical protein
LTEVQIGWTTATETDVDYFEVEKSQNGVDYFTIAAKKSQALNGNSLSSLSYTAMDRSPSETGAYYRIKEVKKGSSFSYSEPLFWDNVLDRNTLIFPNPNKGLFYISLKEMKYAGDVKIQITDPRGVLALEQIYTINADSHAITFDLEDQLKPGVYLCSILMGDNSIRTKLIIQ